MKIKSILIVTFVIMLSGSMLAQPEPGRGKHRGPDFKAERMLQHLKTDLNLTDEQFDSIKDVLFDMEKKMVDIRREAFEERQQRREQHQAMVDETHQKIKEFLTDEQAAELDKIREQRIERRDDRPGYGRGNCPPGAGRRNR